MVQYVSARPGPHERLRELYAYRDLIANLTIRDLKLKYKRSVLGVAWSLLNPVLQMVIYTAVFGVFLHIVSVKNYWAFVIGGILAWGFFSNTLTSASVAFVRNPNLISKVYFPIESIPISMALANLVNFLIPLALLTAALPMAGIRVGAWLVLLPVIALAQLALVVGLSLIVSAVTVFLRDVEHFLVLGLQVLFYLTPILYPLDGRLLPKGAARFIPILHLNPLSWYMGAYHAVVYSGQWPDATEFTLMLLFSAIVLVLGSAVFLRLRPWLPEAV